MKVFSGATGAEVGSYYAFDPSFTGGVNVATGFIGVYTGLTPNIAVAVASGGGPRVVILDRTTGVEQLSLFVFDPSFMGGVRIAAGAALLVVGKGPGSAPLVEGISPYPGNPFWSLLPFDSGFTGGVSVAEVFTPSPPPIV